MRRWPARGPWAFLDPGGVLAIPPLERTPLDPLRVGLVGGVVFLLAELLLRIGLRSGVEPETRALDAFLFAFFYWQVLLAVVVQAAAGAVAAARAREVPGLVAGLAAAAVTGAIATAGIVVGPSVASCVDPIALNPGPCAWSVNAGFTWDVLRQVVAEGALAALACGARRGGGARDPGEARAARGSGGRGAPAGEHLHDLSNGDRTGEEVALPEGAAHLAEAVSLRRLLDPLGDRLQVERAGEADDRLHEPCLAWVVDDVVDELLGDLQLVDREPLQVAERREPGAEVVDRDAHAHGAELCQLGRHALDVFHQGALGDLQDEMARVEPGVGERIADALAEAGLQDLTAGEVDVGRDVLAAGHRRLPFPVSVGRRARVPSGRRR